MNETYTTRDLNDINELIDYTQKIKRELEAWLSVEQQEEMSDRVQNELIEKYHFVKIYKYGLKYSDDIEYLQSWIESVINNSYDMKIQNEINWW